MVDMARLERRRHSRRPLGITVRVAPAGSGLDFPCLCADLSVSGARLLVPAAMPTVLGGSIQITDVSGRIHWRPDHQGSHAATVARVDRQTLLSDGAITLGVCFERAGGV
jgi:hypothetical protein